MHKTLNIAIDVRYLRVAKTGTRTYLEELCNEFKKLQSEQIKFHFLDDGLSIYTGNNKILKWVEHLRHQIWKQLVLPIKAFLKNSDIVFCADDCVPLIHLGYQTIPVIHDAFCFESPQNYGKLWRWLYLNTAIPAAKRSVFVVTPSKWSKKQINFHTGISNDQLIVIPEGPKGFNTPDINNYDILKKHHLDTGNYILHTGSLFKRKNIPSLVEAFGKIKNDGYPQLKLVLAGPTPATQAENDYQSILTTIEKAKLGNDVVLTGYLSDDELSCIYQNALMYVFPSVNEGFGIPILEAFSYNLPVLVANNTCLPEVGGDAVLQFDPFNTDDIYAKIKLVLTNDDLRNNMINKGQQRLKDFSWHQTAFQLIEVFKKAI
jgi:glycosyltransferase involved in cell wall biosynthesis